MHYCTTKISAASRGIDGSSPDRHPFLAKTEGYLEERRKRPYGRIRDLLLLLVWFWCLGGVFEV
ncbi:hypothetical protein MUK42_19629 [Musa troglodytarum]|uniref:Uncharacterized protein n=1 Tax=Musa troglodytarum TaxID=320322 RepID=A0A9E7JED5_9LILI|nr:hypothetical protein MUK42_19629 [Musa troglodytarum]